MTKKKWAMKEQEEWLEERMAAFVQAQQTKTTGQFFTSVYDAWHEKYPSANPSDKQLASANGDMTKARALVIKKEREVSISLASCYSRYVH
jgi:hypothetical protein